MAYANDIRKFFTKHMVNENLGTICNVHVVHADLSEYGALDEKCIKLAELVATAVDFPKTGKIVTMPFELKPKMYPYFMEKEEFQSYKSEKILGKLYRQVIDANDKEVVELKFVPQDILYDADLYIPGSTNFITDAWSHKCSYGGQLNGLVGLYKVGREEEIYSSNKQGQLKERLKHAYSALRKAFRKVFEKMDSDFDQLSDDEKHAIYEQKASAWYQVTYHPSWGKKSTELQEPDGDMAERLKAGDVETVMLSFAWITVDYLSRIKIRCGGDGNADLTKPINAFVRYVADRI
ncbi:unnamed protein product [Ilex paraguariensis]|uniref:RNA-dependent RNA polymerase n=1 Tax=Ilex paraguariensis TaxID=185542 RepID=A0ABC8TBK5_9AQUA